MFNKMFSKKNHKIQHTAIVTIKALLIALVVTMVSVLFFALILKFLDLSNTVILTINQIIKIVSILLCCLFCSKQFKVKWWYGIILGVLYAALSFLLFSLLSGNFSIELSLAYNIMFSGVIGLICSFLVKGFKQI